MERQDLDRLAWAGVELPPGLGYDDTLYFLMLRAACIAMRNMDMTPEQARREKTTIDNAVKTYRADAEFTKYMAKIRLSTGAARAEYRKADTDQGRLRASEKIIEAIDGVEIPKREV